MVGSLEVSGVQVEVDGRGVVKVDGRGGVKVGGVW